MSPPLAPTRLEKRARLQQRLGKNRKSAAKKLVATIEKKGQRFAKAGEELEGAPEDSRMAAAKAPR